MRQEKGDYRGNGVLYIVGMCFVYRLALYSGWIQFDGFNALPICEKIYIKNHSRWPPCPVALSFLPRLQCRLFLDLKQHAQRTPGLF